MHRRLLHQSKPQGRLVWVHYNNSGESRQKDSSFWQFRKDSTFNQAATFNGMHHYMVRRSVWVHSSCVDVKKNLLCTLFLCVEFQYAKVHHGRRRASTVWSVGAKLSVGFYSTPSTKQNKLLQHNPQIGITHTHQFFLVWPAFAIVCIEKYIATKRKPINDFDILLLPTSSIFWECWLIQWHNKTAFENNKHKKHRRECKIKCRFLFDTVNQTEQTVAT